RAGPASPTSCAASASGWRRCRSSTRARPTRFSATTSVVCPVEERDLVVIDTSALLALLANEPEAESFRMALEADPVRLLSAASLVEASAVVEARYGEAGGRELD